MDRLSTKGQMIDQVDLRGVPHSGFDRSNHNYGTGKLGVIIPTRLDEVYPGDRIKGRPEVVANFEPLAAPLMGSMVLKQESFFIPYHQLWKDAYKFFTGKNGFNGRMPSITPKQVFSIYYQYIFAGIFSLDDDTFFKSYQMLLAYRNSVGQDTLPIQSQYSDLGLSGTLLQDFWEATNLIKDFLTNNFEDYKMLDIVLPAVDIFTRFAGMDELHPSEEIVYFSELFEKEITTEEERKRTLDAIDEYIFTLGGLIHEFYNYFMGPSSLFDYLGWPISLFDFKTRKPSSALAFSLPNEVNDWFTAYLYLDSRGRISESVFDYFSAMFSGVPLNFLPFRAYYLCWYWNYRDQLLETDILDPEEDGFLVESVSEEQVLYCTLLRPRCWFKDTFTTALTNTGDGNLLVPLTGVVGTGLEVDFYNGDNLLETKDAASAMSAGATVARYTCDNITYNVPMNYLSSSYNGTSVVSDSTDYISLDLFDRIKRLRTFVQKRLILGYEVDDVIYSSFMVKMSNVRMHIPELLGRGRDAVQMNTIVNNTSIPNGQIAGDKTATAWAHGQMSEVNYFAEEWGFYLQFMTIMPIQSYAGGMQRLYLKREPFDFMWPEFATMGMDAVYNCELAAIGSRLSDEAGTKVFGYQGRYYDLKSRQDEEHGRLLTDLNYLTFSREFDNDNPPKLNYIFVHCHPRLDGFVVESPLEDVFRYDCYTAQGWERRLPVPSEIVG